MIFNLIFVWSVLGIVFCLSALVQIGPDSAKEFYQGVGVKSIAQGIILTLALGPLTWSIAGIVCIIKMFISNIKGIWNWLERFGKFE